MFYGDIDNSGEILIQKPVLPGSIGVNQLVNDLNSANSSNNSTFSTNDTCADCVECQPYGIAGYLLGLLAFGTVVPMLFGSNTRTVAPIKRLKKKKDEVAGGTVIRKSESKKVARQIRQYRKKQKNDNITINVN